MRKFKKLTMTLAALITAATGAWAQESNVIKPTPVTEGKQWTFTMPASNVELQVEYEPEFTAAFKAGNANTIQSGEGSKATVTVTEKDGTTAYTGATFDENGNYKPLYEKQKITLTAAAGYKFKNILTYPVALSAVTADYLGSVVCSNGKVYPAKTAVPAGCTAVGILGKVTETGHGLIIALKNATGQNWNTIDGWASVAYAGTTLKVLPDDAARGANLTSYTTLGETTVSNWAVAQKSDYEAIFINLGSTKSDSDGTTYDSNVNAYITTGVGGTAISGDYWSATDAGGPAWRFKSKWWNASDKTGSYSVRPVLGF